MPIETTAKLDVAAYTSCETEPAEQDDDEADGAGHAFTFSNARANFRNLVNQAADLGDRIMITRHGKPVAAIVPIEDVERLEAADLSARTKMRRPSELGEAQIELTPQDDERASPELVEQVVELMHLISQNEEVAAFLDSRREGMTAPRPQPVPAAATAPNVASAQPEPEAEADALERES